MSKYPRECSFHTNSEADCIALLSACWKNRGKRQTQSIISEWAGISQQRVSKLINSEKEWGPNDSILAITAQKYGFVYKVFNKPGLVIDVVYVGNITDKYD